MMTLKGEATAAWITSSDAAVPHYNRQLARERHTMLLGTLADLVDTCAGEQGLVLDAAREALGALSLQMAHVKQSS